MELLKPRQMVFQTLSTNGDGTGTTNAVGDYTDTDFWIGGGTTYQYGIYRMLVFISDTGPFSADDYGGISALTNGIRVIVRDDTDTEILDLTGGQTIKSNAQWAQVCYDATPSNYGSGADFVHVRWTFSKAGSPILIKNNHKMAVVLNDDFTGLLNHTFMVQGARA